MSLREELLEPRCPRMASSLLFYRYLILSALCVSLSFETVDAAKPPFSFSLERFEKNHSFSSQMSLYGDAEIGDSMVKLTRPVISSSGGVMYKKPIRFWGTSPGFSTYFSFSVSNGNGSSLAFLLVPNNNGNRFGLSPSFLAVKFVTGSNETHIEIDVGGEMSVKSSNLSFVDLVLSRGQKLHFWIDNDGVAKMVEVRLSKSGALRPSSSLLSCPIDLSNVLWREAMYVGISSSSGNSTQTSTIYSWSFVVNHGAPYLMHSEPLDPQSFSVQTNEDPPVQVRRNYPWRIIMALMFGAACGALVASMVCVLWSKVVERHPVAPVECPVVSLEIGCDCEKILLGGNKAVDSATKR